MIIKIVAEKTNKLLGSCDMALIALDGFTEFVEKWAIEKRVNDLIALKATGHKELVLKCKFSLEWPA